MDAVGSIEVGQSADGEGRLRRMTLEATVIRADGTVEVLGVIADSGDLIEGDEK